MNLATPNVAVTLLLVSALGSGAMAQTPSPAPSSTPMAAVGAPQNVTTVFVPKGTAVIVETGEGLSSYAASSREPITYALDQDVVINGYVVAKSGDEAQGQVLESQQGKAGFYGVGRKGGDLRISVDSVNNFCGDTLKVHFIRTEFRQRQGLLGSNKDVQVIKGQKYIATVAYPQKICGQATTEAAPPIPAGALDGDKG